MDNSADCRTVSDAFEKSKEITTTNGLDWSRLVTVWSKKMIAADVEPVGQDANLSENVRVWVGLRNAG